MNQQTRIGTTKRALAAGLSIGLLLAGCATPTQLPSGPKAYQIMGDAASDNIPEYRIGPSDLISVVVFNEADLSAPSVRVDTAGNISLPMIGMVAVRDKTVTQVAREIESRLTPRIVVSPQVTVNLIETASQRVTIEGEVAQPGVFQITGPSNLLEVLAMSRGPTRTANLDEIAIFRVIDGQQMAAKFDLRAIRRGEAPNPAVRGNDIVVVGFNHLQGAWRDFLQAVPMLTLFSRPFY